MPPGHGTGCFFAPPRKSVHELVYILGAPKKHPQIPEVALVDFTPIGANGHAELWQTLQVLTFQAKPGKECN